MYCWPELFRPPERGEAGSVPAFRVARDKRCVGDSAKIDWGMSDPHVNRRLLFTTTVADGSKFPTSAT